MSRASAHPVSSKAESDREAWSNTCISAPKARQDNEVEEATVANVNPVQIQKYLDGVNYPASKQDLVNKAKQEGASQDVLQTLEKMPGKQYNGPVDVSEAVGKIE